MTPLKKTLISLTAISCAQLAIAQTTWTGATDTVWDTNSNWTANSPGFNGTAVFSGAVTANQPDVFAANQIGHALDFQSAGWTINSSGGGTIRVDGGLFINSSGSGVNTINAGIAGSGGLSLPITVNSGNTLVFNGPTFTNANPKDFSGTGTVVYSGGDMAVLNQLVSFSGATTFLANSTWASSVMTVNNGATFGGTGGLIISAYQTITFGDTGTFAPGGNGTFGSEIGTFSLGSSNTNRAEVVIDNGSTVAMNIGSGGIGDNDKIEFDLNGGGNITINAGATLSIVGSTILDGTYTLFENTDDSDPITGTFDTVLFNGDPINPSNFTVNYNADFISLDVSGIVPEPSTYALLLGASIGLVALIRRRRS